MEAALRGGQRPPKQRQVACEIGVALNHVVVHFEPALNIDGRNGGRGRQLLASRTGAEQVGRGIPFVAHVGQRCSGTSGQRSGRGPVRGRRVELTGACGERSPTGIPRVCLRSDLPSPCHAKVDHQRHHHHEQRQRENEFERREAATRMGNDCGDCLKACHGLSSWGGLLLHSAWTSISMSAQDVEVLW